MNQRASGILLHLTSLSNPYRIGDLGPAAVVFVDFMLESGQRWWQMLPIGPAGGENSPYQSPSAFRGNPLLVSPDRLVEQGLLGRQDIELHTGTHDNDTTAGWYRKLPSTQREALQQKLGINDQEIVWTMICEALASQSDTAIVPAQDLLELGSDARMNFPGTAKGNWQWRLKDGALTQELAQRLRNLATTYGRLSGGEPRPVPRCQEDDPTPQIAKRASAP